MTGGHATALRVLHVTPFLWSGAGQVITSLVESQAERHDVAVTSSGRSRGERDWPAYRARLRRAGAACDRVDLFDRDPAVFWPAVSRLQATIDAVRPDVVHSHAGVPACAVAMARTSARPFAHISQVYSWGVGRPSWMNTMDARAHAQADAVVVSSAAYRDRLLAGGVDGRRMVLLPWGLAPSTIDADRREPRTLVIGCVGRIEPRKGQADLVEAFARIRRERPDARLELVGPVADERYAAVIRRLIQVHGLGDAVRLRGHVPSVPKVISRWSLFVSLASDEGQGLAILEAMALGVPVAAVPCAGVEDYLRPGRNAIGLPSRRPGAVARALLSALDAPLVMARVVRTAERLIAAHYTWDATVTAFDDLYRKARTWRAADARRVLGSAGGRRPGAAAGCDAAA